MKIPDGLIVHIGYESFIGNVPDVKAKAVGLEFPKPEPPVPPGKAEK